MTRYELNGLALEVEAESPDLMRAVESLLGDFAVAETQYEPFLLTLARGPAPVHAAIPADMRVFWDGVLPGGLHTVYCTGGERRKIIVPGLAQAWIDLAARRADIRVAPDGEGYTRYGCVIPVLCEFWAAVGQQVIHAGSLAFGAGDEARAVLVSGESGAGKTSTVLALAHAGLAMMADDACFVGASGTAAPPVMVWGLPLSCKVHPHTFTLLPWLNDVPHRSAQGTEELVLDTTAFPTRSYEKVKPGLILFLDPRHDGEHVLRPLDKLAALTRLTRENVRAPDPRAAGPAGRAFARVAELVKASDTYVASVGPDLAHFPELIRPLLNR